MFRRLVTTDMSIDCKRLDNYMYALSLVYTCTLYLVTFRSI